MAKINFMLRSKVKNQPAKFTLRLVNGRDNTFFVTTSLLTYPEFWSNSLQRFNKKTISENSLVDMKSINEIEAKIEDIKTKISAELMDKGTITKKTVLSIIENKQPKNKKIEKVVEYIERYLLEMKSGKRLTDNKKQYQHGTTKNYNTFKNILGQYEGEQKAKLTFEQITIDFYDDFTQYMTRKNFTPSTIGRHIKHLKTIMRAAMEEGLHKNSEFQRRRFKAPSNTTVDIYLTEQEVRKIYNLELTGTDEIIRDVFLIGCYTAQRYSDYTTLKPENVSGNIIHLYQQKTGAEVNIPIRPELRQILNKYNNQMPRTDNQKINTRIKQIARAAGITDPVLVEKINGGLKIKKTVEKCEMVKTHTGRRSCATNMYLAGINTIDIMKITGHKTEREFLKYIKIGSEETANSLQNHPFFKGTVLTASHG